MKNVIAAAEAWALAEIKEYHAPREELLRCSYEKGQELATTLGADKEVVALGTLLMDIQIGKAMSEGKIQQHIAMGVAVTIPFLEKHGVTPETQKKIINCIQAHHGTAPYECMEAEICANADCYRFILPNNVFVFIIDLVNRREMSLAAALDFAYAKLEEKHAILSIESCKEELEPHYRAFKHLFEAAGAKPKAPV